MNVFGKLAQALQGDRHFPTHRMDFPIRVSLRESGDVPVRYLDSCLPFAFVATFLYESWAVLFSVMMVCHWGSLVCLLGITLRG